MIDAKIAMEVSDSLVVVGGDACFRASKETWKAAWVIVSTRLHKAPAGSMVAFGPQKGSPDELASASARKLSHASVRFDRDGKFYVRKKDQEAYGLGGQWSDSPTPDGLSMELAHQLSLCRAQGWKTHCLILHGWDGSFRGERLAERVRHLGGEVEEWDVSVDGKAMVR